MKQTLYPCSLKNFVFSLKIILLLVWFSPFQGFCTTASEGPLTVVIQGTDPACGGFPNGSAVAIASGGTAPYTYLWSTGATTVALDFIPAGEYTVTVTDVFSATATASVTLLEPPVFLAPITNIVCGASGSLTVSPSGGVPPYTINWSNGATTPTASNLSPGSYCVTVVDVNYCGIISCASVGMPPGVTVVTTGAGCNGGSFGSAKAFPSGGTPPYTFLWNTGQTTQIIQNLPAGTYTVTVTDNNGCTGTASGVVEGQADGFTVSLSATEPGCASNNGTITAIPTGGNPPLVYNWSNGGSGQTITNLGPGNYSVTVTDATGCTATASTFLNAPQNLVVMAWATNETCYNANDGMASASASGGLPPFTFAWSNGATGQSIFNLSPGTYMVTATSSEGCTGTATATVAGAPFFTLSFMTYDVTVCGGNDGKATVFRNGGTPPFSYLWSTGSTSPTIANLIAGTYSVTVTDANGCEAIGSAIVGGPADLSVSIDGTSVICEDGSSGMATAIVTGGTPPFNYLWNTGATTAAISGLPPGTYSVTVSDAAGCDGTASIGITGDFFIIDFSVENILCYGESSGTIVAAGWGGVPPYTYLWNTGSTNPEISNVPAGIYSVTVTDALGCSFSDSIELTQPPPFGVNISSSNGGCTPNNGEATANPFGGTPPYSYLWSTGSTAQTIMNLSPGTYFVTVTDANGCQVNCSTVINGPSNLSVSIDGTGLICGNDNSGTATAVVSGGTAPFSYLWNTGATTATISGLFPGTYSVTVTDAAGCDGTATIVISGDFFIVDFSFQNVLCYGESSGIIVAAGWGGVPPYTYLWNTGSTNPEISNIPAGTYSVTVTDALGCSFSNSIEITQPPLLGVNIASSSGGCTPNSGMATANAFGGTPPYRYLWNTGDTTMAISNLPSGTYTVTVTDANLCTTTAFTNITLGSDLSLNINSVNISCNGDFDGFAMVIATGGTPPYSYLWNTGSTTGGIAGIGAGTYTVTVTDATGCSETASVTLTEPPPIVINISTTNASCGNNDGSLTASASGGVPPYSYAWNNGENTATINNLAPGTYFLTVTDANNCTNTAVAQILGGDGFTIEIVSENVSCYGAKDGFAIANIIGGTPPFTFQWNTGATTAMINNLPPGQYFVTVTDADGCTEMASVIITGPPPIVLSISKTNETCAGNNDGTATIAVLSGGTPPFSYQWNTGATTAIINNLPPGTYSVTVTDANGCTKTAMVTIGGPPPIVLSISKMNETCAGSNDGTASVVVSSGGMPPFDYLWNTGQTSSSITNLPPGTYSVTVTDANGCVAVGSTTVNPGSNLSIFISSSDVSCNGGNDGSATVNATNGTAPFSYSWSNGQSAQSIFNLTAGTYSVTVTDSNGCVAVASVIITQPAPMLVLTSVLSTTCEGSSDGSINAIVVGGQSPFTFAWSNGDFGATISNLSAGTYSVTVTDANACTATAVEFVPALPSPSCSASVTQEISSMGGSDGEATVQASGGTPPYDFSWSNGQTGTVASNLSAGTVTVTVTDFKGCFSTCSVTLMDRECDNATDPGTICCDQNLCGPGNDPDPIVETSPPIGGVGTLEFLWMFHTAPGPFDPNIWTVIPGANGPSYDPGLLFETTYFIRCVRRQGCIDFLESNIVTITVNLEAFALINGPNSVCFGNPTTYSASFSGTGATYEWDFGFGATPATANTQVVPDVEWSSPGVKTITLTVVRNGCTSVDILQVNVSNSPIYCGSAFVIHADPLSQEMVLIEWDLNGFSQDDQSFVVERSADKEEFEKIGEVERIFTGGTTNHYEYFDKTPKKGRSFYRVKWMNSNDSFIVSNTEEVLLDEGISGIMVYPNPVEKTLFLEILDDISEKVSVDIITTNGVFVKSIEVPAGAFRKEIDLSLLARGVYVLVVNYDGKPQKTIRVVKT